MKTTLKQLSLCQCGFTMLDESIPLGTEYEIEPSMTAECEIICGGCKRKYPVKAVYVYSRGSSLGGYLPEDIFKEKQMVLAT